MQIIIELIEFMFGLLNISIPIGSYNFSLGGAILFAGIVVIFIGFITWLIGKE